ncbi:toxin-antitoxin system HicB family antitoxin [Streptomyces sp. NPDC054855]
MPTPETRGCAERLPGAKDHYYGGGMSVFTVRIPDDLDAEVRKAAAEAGLSLNAYMVRTLRDQTLREALAAVDSEGVLLVDIGDDDPAGDIR